MADGMSEFCIFGIEAFLFLLESYVIKFFSYVSEYLGKALETI